MSTFSLVLYGATGYVGGLVAEYLAKIPDLKWAVAGRDEEKLKKLIGKLKSEFKTNPEYIVATVNDKESIDRMVSSCQVFITTVGPFINHGIPLVEACVRNKTHYVDTSGEPFFVRKIIDLYHDEAVKQGVKIVPSCGFDCLFSDMGVYFLTKYFESQQAKPISIGNAILKYEAGMSAGTMASTTNVWQQHSASEIIEMSKNEDFYIPGSHRQVKKGEFYYDDLNKGYKTPSTMETANIRYVRRSNYLLNYSNEFDYYEGMYTKSFFSGFASTAKHFCFIGSMFVPPLRWLTNKMYKPGQGPTKEDLNKGKLLMQFGGRAKKDDGSEIIQFATVEFNQDPGYVGTAVLVAESALCLLNKPKTTHKGGVLTGASAMGADLLERLKAAGVTFSLIDN